MAITLVNILAISIVSNIVAFVCCKINYYVKIISLLSDLGIDYEDDYKRTIFNISPIQNGEQTIKLTQRDIKKRNKKAE